MPGTLVPSFWLRTLSPEERIDLVPLEADANPDADVVIVGGGYSGLWTAWFLRQRDPGLRITVIERHGIGHGASGRNGGWASALSPVSLPELERRHGLQSAIFLQQELISAVHQLHGLIVENDLEPGVVAGGTLDLIRSPAQAERARRTLGNWRRFGFGADDIRWLSADETQSEIVASDTRGALYTPHCLALNPARLAHRLAKKLSDEGVRLRRGDVTDLGPGGIRTTTSELRAPVVILATEAYRSQLPGRRRDVIPLYSMMVITPPLSSEQWAAIGLHRRSTFADLRHGVIYGQRTDDGRLAFGGRGAPYHYRSAISERFDTHQPTRERLRQTIIELFPSLADVGIDDHWGGPLAMPRDLHPTVTYDNGFGVLGGYVGDGVTSSFLAAQTMADLVTGHLTPLTRLAWVDHRSPSWEPEPLRWIGINAMRRLADRADRRESRRPSSDALSGRLVRRVLRR